MNAHDELCGCAKCYASALGGWIDQLGRGTSGGCWQIFGTLTYATRSYPWKQGFPQTGSGRPHPDFAHNLFNGLVAHLESEVGRQIDYVVADQFGRVGGRFHQHCLLAAEGLAEYSRRNIWQWLKERAGWSRILPFEHGAAHYISRYIGRDANECEWIFRVGDMQSPLQIEKPAVGKVVIVHSAWVDKELLHTGINNRKR